MFREQWPDELEAFWHALQLAQRKSIDSFLNTRREFDRIGRHAIASAIMQAEHSTAWDRASGFIGPNPTTARDTWYCDLLDSFGESVEEVRATPLRIITFNYDRSLAQYLIVSLANRLRISTEEAWHAIEVMDIVHVYGSLGATVHIDSNNPFIPYGTPPLALANIALCADNIKVVGDRADDLPSLVSARSELSAARRIVILDSDLIRQTLIVFFADWNWAISLSEAPRTRFRSVARRISP